MKLFTVDTFEEETGLWKGVWRKVSFWSVLYLDATKFLHSFEVKNDRMISVHFQGKPFNITVVQVYAPTSNTEEAEVEQFYEDL